MLSPVTMRRVQGILTIFWALMIPVSFVTGLVHSVAFISLLSLLALVLSQGTWWAAASVEARNIEEDTATEVVDQMVKKTDTKRSP